MNWPKKPVTYSKTLVLPLWFAFFVSRRAEYVAITIKPEGFVGPSFRLDRAEPNNCDF